MDIQLHQNDLPDGLDQAAVQKIYEDYYADDRLIRMRPAGAPPEVAAVAATDELPDAPFHELLRVSLGKLSRA